MAMAISKRRDADWHYATDLIRRVCVLAGRLNLVEDFQARPRGYGVQKAVRHHDTAVLFAWLLEELSFQGTPMPWPRATWTRMAPCDIESLRPAL